MMSMLAAFCLAGILYRVRRNETARAGLLVLIVGLYIVEIGNVSLAGLPHKEEKNRNIFLKGFAETKELAQFLKRQQMPLRVDVNENDISINFGDWYGIDSMNGYVASHPVNFSEIEAYTPRTKMLYGVNYTLSKKPTMPGQEELFRDANGVIVFKNPNVLPRVWTVHEAIQVKNPQDARNHLQDPNFDLRKKTFGYAVPPRLEQCDGDQIRYFGRDTNSTTAMVDMKCRGLLVESENDAAGWIALVDGVKTPVYEAYGVLRGVVVGPGAHKVEMRYRPLSVIDGAVATLSAFIGALVLVAVSWRKRRQGET
jgi:hypothetical protein